MSNTSDEEFHAFMTSWWPSLLRTAYLLTSSHHDAEDLAQNALARAYVKWDRVRHSDDMAAHVRRIMIHVHADRFRRRAVREWFTPRLPETSVAVRTADVDRRSDRRARSESGRGARGGGLHHRVRGPFQGASAVTVTVRAADGTILCGQAKGRRRPRPHRRTVRRLHRFPHRRVPAAPSRTWPAHRWSRPSRMVRGALRAR